MTADVQIWLDNPTQNFGWILIGNEVDANSSKRFETRETADPLLRPSLTIKYVPPE
jgi:hypothetical protein